jgi:hypothetical protein
VAHAAKGGDGKVEDDADAAAALPHAVAPVGVPGVYSCGGAEERKGCDGGAAACAGAEERKRCDGDAAATFAHALATVTENRPAAWSSIGSIEIK